MNVEGGNGWGAPANPPPFTRPRGSLGSLWFTGVPLGIIKTYRFIPTNTRSLWSFGTSSSHLAMASPSWTSLMHYGTPRLGVDKIAPGWDSPPPVYPGGRAKASSTGWDTFPPTPSPPMVFKMFIVGWFKLFMIIPLAILGIDWGGGEGGWGASMADGPNWETSPPSR
jgi:hypothetical protein